MSSSKHKKLQNHFDRTNVLSKMGTKAHQFIKTVIELPDIDKSTKESQTIVNKQYTDQF